MDDVSAKMQSSLKRIVPASCDSVLAGVTVINTINILVL